MNQNQYMKFFIGIMLFVTWVALVVFKVPGTEDIIGTIKLALAGLGVYHIKDAASTVAMATPTNRQGGFASLAMLIVVALLAVLLSGCAGAIQAVQAYGAVAVSNAKATNDAVIEAQKVTFCGLPLSAVARHPEIIPAVRVLCVAASDSTTSGLLDAIEAKPEQKR